MQEQSAENFVKEPKKSGTGRKILIVFLVLLLLLAGGIFWGYRTVTSVMGLEDLGVSYTYEDYEDLVENIGIEVEPEKLCLDCEALDFSEPHEIELTVTNSQASAAFEIANRELSFAGISDTQIRFSDNKGEMSTIVTYQGRSYPVYISGNVVKASDTTVSGEIFDLKVGGLNIPSGIVNMAEEALTNLANERMATMGDTFRIDNAELTNEGLNFEGMVPTLAK